ncbi:MAG: hypothetical protein PF692_08430 [Kiritimatiellae bacterium]|jgi:chromosome segregation ATPase|nr:hypothetical protein [Kiritimatiellia bacterium]
MIKRYILGLFLGMFVVFCSAEEVNLQDMLKSLEQEKVSADKEVEASRNNIDELKTKNTNLRKSFLDNKRNLQPNTFKFTDEETTKKLEDLKAVLKKLDEERKKVLEEIRAVMDSDAEYKKLNDESNKQLEDIKGLRELQSKANVRFTEALKTQREVDGKISDIKKQIEAKNKEAQNGDKE